MMANISTLLLSVLLLVAVSPTLTFAQAPRQGPPGSLFTVSASGFRSYELVVSIKMGRVELMAAALLIPMVMGLSRLRTSRCLAWTLEYMLSS